MKKFLVLLLSALFAVSILFAMGGKESKDQKPAAPPSGVIGKIEIWEGNFMPMTDKSAIAKQVKPGAGMKVRLHEPVRGSSGTVIAEIPTPLIAETVSDDSGRFMIPAHEGKYSLFIEDKNGWYANGWDGDGVQGAVTVEPFKMTEVLIKNTTRATF